jgi:hypothetical protein
MQIEWAKATGTDVADIVSMAHNDFAQEVDTVFAIDPHAYAHNVAMAVVDQMYNPFGNLVMVARDPDRHLLAYTWCVRGERACWSTEEMAAVRMAHVDLSLTAVQRVRLIQQMIAFWEVWAQSCGIDIVCSTTMRHDQSGFLRLHERHGYSVRGSIAYKRLGAHNV